MKFKFASFLILNLLIVHCAIGQHGEVDLSFNPYDTTLFGTYIGPDDEVKIIYEQLDGKRIVAGEFLNYNGELKKYITRITSSGALDTSFNQSQFDLGFSISGLDVQGDGKIIVGGGISVTNLGYRNIVRLNSDGTVDTTFDTGPTPGGYVRKIKIQPNGKILVAGNFTGWNGSPSKIIRLNTDGTIDSTFLVNGTISYIHDIGLLSTGEIIITGDFTSLNGISCKGYAKLNSDGTAVTGFTYDSFLGVANFWHKSQVQDDDKTIIQSSGKLYRINSNGTIDTSFTNSNGGSIHALKLLSSGKIAIGGGFNSFNGHPSKRVAVLNNDGTVDTTFNTQINGNSPGVKCITETITGNLAIGGTFTKVNMAMHTNLTEVDLTGTTIIPPLGIQQGFVFSLAIQPDNKILVGGSFTHYAGQASRGLARLNMNGELDTAFQNKLGLGVAGEIQDIYVLPNQKILVGGNFLSVNGYPADRIARINADGSVDTTFNGPTFLHGGVNSIDVQPNGKILVGGNFRYVNGSPQDYIARLEVDGAYDNSFFSPLWDNVTFGMSANKIQIVSNSKIMVTGKFACCNPVVRLNANGTIDGSFYFNLSGTVYDFVELDNGKYIIGGTAFSNNGQVPYLLMGINSDGSYDPTFNETNPGYFGYSSSLVKTINRISDDHILVSGTFPSVPNGTRNAFILSNSGQRDTLFDVPESFSMGQVRALDIQSDGRIIVAGNFDYIGSVKRNGIARLHRSTFLTDQVDCEDTTYQFGNWLIDPVLPGTYVDTLQSAMGTDSIVSLTLTLNNTLIKDMSQFDEFTLFAEESGYSYHWIDCVSNATVIGETNQYFSPSTPGTYAVELTLNHCVDTSNCVTINFCNSISDYSYVDNGNGNYSFTNSSTGDFTDVHWAFGDGSTSILENPNHTFNTNGTYYVVLTVNDSVNTITCFDYFIDTIIVSNAPVQLDCNAGFVVYPDTNGGVNVINSSTGNNLSYLWDFGDGTTSTQQNPTHNYNSNGPFYLCLTVDNQAGCVDFYCDSIGENGVVFKANGFTINVSSTPNTVGLNNEVNLNLEVDIYPNPTSNQLSILTELSLNKVTIFDFTGKILKTAIDGFDKIDVSDLSSGTYFIVLSTEKGSINKRFVKL
ncbi:PKD domain-containing protein [Brumimicrobium glaciale]|uniref:PKD domain-containing protein n=1 Tax=Brumimicrobium glaciale TaxID=200475 RepID=A0A4V1WFX9_9FLAO|nr:PKD domain-containing protein [Brumimicrobium glaciale]RYM34756.1 PKD domain-containing protein [Brumimicrobium glaciale]